MTIKGAEYWLLASGSTVKPKPTRPAAVAHTALPPWDPNDSGGDVHTVQPPELVIPDHFKDPAFMRADFNGVTLDSARWGGHPPMLLGANSTPVDMLMTPMLILYPRVWQDRCLTEHAERGYDDFVISGDGWNLAANDFNPTPAAIVQWAQYVASWGFRIVYWRGQPMLNDPILQALVDAKVIGYSIPGEEVDSKLTSQQYGAIIDNTLSIVANGIPVGAHFTCGPRGGWPIDFPRDTFLTNWADYDGRVHLCLQSNQNNSAGSQAAILYYARQRIALGTIGGDGRPAPNSRVCLFETMATKQLYGQCDELYGNLRTLEMLYATRDNASIRAVDGGFGNGCRLSTGGVL